MGGDIRTHFYVANIEKVVRKSCEILSKGFECRKIQKEIEFVNNICSVKGV